jgi:hypothetical protein
LFVYTKEIGRLQIRAGDPGVREQNSMMQDRIVHEREMAIECTTGQMQMRGRGA